MAVWICEIPQAADKTLTQRLFICLSLAFRPFRFRWNDSAKIKNNIVWKIKKKYYCSFKEIRANFHTMDRWWCVPWHWRHWTDPRPLDLQMQRGLYAVPAVFFKNFQQIFARQGEVKQIMGTCWYLVLKVKKGFMVIIWHTLFLLCSKHNFFYFWNAFSLFELTNQPPRVLAFPHNPII